MPEKGRRTVVVTGGSRGIGRAICLALAKSDTQVYFNYFNPGDPEGEAAAAKETEKLVAQANASVSSRSVNVASEDEVNEFVDSIMAETGRIDVWVNNAGITKDSLLVRMKTQAWDDVIEVNLKGTFLCSRAVAKIMMKQRCGRIINIASVVGVIGNPGQSNYVASKAGIIGLTKSMAKELAPRGITVNAVAPGFIETDMTASLPQNVKDAFLVQIPLGRAGQPEDVALSVVFLASEAASYLTGQVLHVSGGMYI
ncbi:MAG: 3-oxoacyl-[acyl-carrier-protein] reductase [Desulfobacterales bacterium]